MAKGAPGITGFDMRKMIASAGHHPNDPWKRQYVYPSNVNLHTDHDGSEAWRYTGPFTRRNRWKNTFPGIGIATVAFAAYCAYEYVFLKDDHAHDSSHGDTTVSGH